MTFKRKLRDAVNVLLAEDVEFSVTEETVATKPRRLEDKDVDDFMLAAESRDDPLWDDIFAYLQGELRREYPFRSTRIIKDLKWLRKRAARAGLEWGSLD